MTDIDDFAQLISLMQASERYHLREIEHGKRMKKISANSPEVEFREKLKWLAANGNGSEIKKMIEERQSSE